MCLDWFGLVPITLPLYIITIIIGWCFCETPNMTSSLVLWFSCYLNILGISEVLWDVGCYIVLVCLGPPYLCVERDILIPVFWSYWTSHSCKNSNDRSMDWGFPRDVTLPSTVYLACQIWTSYIPFIALFGDFIIFLSTVCFATLGHYFRETCACYSRWVFQTYSR